MTGPLRVNSTNRQNPVSVPDQLQLFRPDSVSKISRKTCTLLITTPQQLHLSLSGSHKLLNAVGGAGGGEETGIQRGWRLLCRVHTDGRQRGAELLTGGRRHRTAPLSDGHSWPGSQKYSGQQHGGQHHKSMYQHHDRQHHDGQLVYLPG